MKLRLFTLPNCPKCPAAKDLINTVKEKRKDLTIEILDISKSENFTTALMLQVFSTPSFLINDTPIFIGEVPSIEELEGKIEECKK